MSFSSFPATGTGMSGLEDGFTTGEKGLQSLVNQVSERGRKTSLLGEHGFQFRLHLLLYKPVYQFLHFFS